MFHIAGMREDGDTFPEPRTSVAEAAAYHNENVFEPVGWTDAAELVAIIAVETDIGMEQALATDR